MLLTENMHDVFVVEGDDTKTVHDNIKRYIEKIDSFSALEGNAPKIVFSNVGYVDHESVPMVRTRVLFIFQLLLNTRVQSLRTCIQ